MFKASYALFLLSYSTGLVYALDICENQINGVHLSHPADCSKFVECQNEKTNRILDCPLGLHFNRFKGVCDLRQRAACDVAFMNFASEEKNCSACCALFGCFVNPECPENPGTSGTPATAITPTSSETCTTSETNPTTSYTKSTSVARETSTTPEIPTTSHTPDTSGTSETPTTSNSTNTPPPATVPTSNTPSTGATDTPASPETPITTEIPTTSQTINTSSTPESSNTTSTPNTPATLPTPDTSNTSTTDNTPNSPETPATSATTTTPNTSGTSDTPATPPTPATLPTPDTSSTGATDKPGSTVTPPSPETPAPNDNNCLHNSTVCVGKPDGSVAYVNGTCNQYIVCVGGCAIVMSCPNNLQYNITTQNCDYPKNVNCPWQSTPPITGPSGVTCAQQGKCAGQQDGMLFPNSNGNGYIVCQCECEVERPCPVGTKFDEHLLTCAQERVNENYNTSDNYSKNFKRRNIICNNDIEICQNQTDGTLIPIEGVCDKFYKCNFGCAVEVQCPNNLIYNPSLSYCDYPQNYKCPWPYTSNTRPLAGPSGIECANSGRCSGQPEGTILPSLTTCSKYIICQCECEVEMECPADLLWDNKLLTCNHPENVSCDFHSLNYK